jgi:hypothetical protein
MHTVQIEHPVRDFDGWKLAFDRDPARREASGVRCYRIFRPVDDSHFVCIDLDFDTRAAAETFVTVMQPIWQRVEGTVITGPRVRIVECVERHEYSGVVAPLGTSPSGAAAT